MAVAAKQESARRRLDSHTAELARRADEAREKVVGQRTASDQALRRAPPSASELWYVCASAISDNNRKLLTTLYFQSSVDDDLPPPSKYSSSCCAFLFAGLWRLSCCLRGGVTTGDAYLFDRPGGFSGGVSLDEPLLPASSLTRNTRNTLHLSLAAWNTEPETAVWCPRS